MVAEMAGGGELSTDLADRVLERSAGNPCSSRPCFTASGLPRPGNPTTGCRRRSTRCSSPGSTPCRRRRGARSSSHPSWAWSSRRTPLRHCPTMAASTWRRRSASLQRAELIASSGANHGWTVRHPLIHEVAYGSLLLSTRRALHGRIGQWLEEHGGEELLPELARHYRDSDDLAKARTYLPLAGRHAESLSAIREAFGWFTDAAAAYADEPMKRAEMLESSARQIHLLGDIVEARKLQEEAIATYESVGATREALNSRRWLSRYIWLEGDPKEAQRQIGLAIEGLEKFGPSAELALAYSFRAQSLMLIRSSTRRSSWHAGRSRSPSRSAPTKCSSTRTTTSAARCSARATPKASSTCSAAGTSRSSTTCPMTSAAHTRTSSVGVPHLPVPQRGVGGVPARGDRILRLNRPRWHLRPVAPLRLGRIPPHQRPMARVRAGTCQAQRTPRRGLPADRGAEACRRCSWPIVAVSTRPPRSRPERRRPRSASLTSRPSCRRC